MKFKIYYILVVIALIFSCKKEKNQPKEVVKYSNYSNLKIGNQWIYQVFEYDGKGKITPLDIYDTTVLERDTIINGNLYFKLSIYDYVYEKKSFEYLRDSLHYIVDINGKIKFSSQDFTSVFYSSYYKINNDTFFKLTEKMEDKNMLISVPAGNFISSCYRLTFEIYPKFAGSEKIKIRNFRYVENIGLISETLVGYVDEIGYKEKKLIKLIGN